MTVEWFLEKNGAPKSQSQRKYVWKKWVEYTNYCDSRKIQHSPITGRILAEFAVWWFSSGKVSADSLQVYLSALNHVFHDKGLGLDRAKDTVICAHVIGGMRNGKKQRALRSP